MVIFYRQETTTVKQSNFKMQKIKDSYAYFLTDSMLNFSCCCSSDGVG